MTGGGHVFGGSEVERFKGSKVQRLRHKGTFGICEACGDEIDMQRLEARPVTTYCIACKKKMEAIEQSRRN